MSREDDKDSTQFRRPASYRRNAREAAQAAHAREAEGRRVAAQRPAAQRPQARPAAGETVVRPQRRAQAAAPAPAQHARQAEQIRRPQHARSAQQRPVMAPRGYAGGATGFVPDYQFDYGRRRGHRGLSALLAVLVVVFRLGAIALAVLVVANAFTLSGRVDVAAITARVSAFVPAQFSAMPMVDTPFGGVFRGDLALASVILFVLDWICSRIRWRVRS